jgi:hypothetical protein
MSTITPDDAVSMGDILAQVTEIRSIAREEIAGSGRRAGADAGGTDRRPSGGARGNRHPARRHGRDQDPGSTEFR